MKKIGSGNNLKNLNVENVYEKKKSKISILIFNLAKIFYVSHFQECADVIT